MSKKKRKALANPAVVTFRMVSIDFNARTVTIDGRKIGPIEQVVLEFPILSGDAVFMPSRDMERFA